MRVGEPVLAIGNPLGLGQTVTQGIVSATGRGQLGVTTFENFIQTDAAINFGNSGGALVDASGKLVGLNSAIAGRQAGIEGIGFAIPVDLVRGVVDAIIRDGKVVRGWIGVVPRDLTPAGDRALRRARRLGPGALRLRGTAPPIAAGRRRQRRDHAGERQAAARRAGPARADRDAASPASRSDCGSGARRRRAARATNTTCASRSIERPQEAGAMRSS